MLDDNSSKGFDKKLPDKVTAVDPLTASLMDSAEERKQIVPNVKAVVKPQKKEEEVDISTDYMPSVEPNKATPRRRRSVTPSLSPQTLPSSELGLQLSPKLELKSSSEPKASLSRQSSG